jgi:hypothetical protein
MERHEIVFQNVPKRFTTPSPAPKSKVDETLMERSRLRPPHHLITLPRPMKAKQRHDLATNALARELEGLPDKLKRWANTLLTVILVGAAVFMLVRWRMNSAEQAKQEILSQLSIAQSGALELGREVGSGNPEYIAHARSAIVAQVRDAVTSVLNNSDDP